MICHLKKWWNHFEQILKKDDRVLFFSENEVNCHLRWRKSSGYEEHQLDLYINFTLGSNLGSQTKHSKNDLIFLLFLQKYSMLKRKLKNVIDFFFDSIFIILIYYIAFQNIKNLEHLILTNCYLSYCMENDFFYCKHFTCELWWFEVLK